MYRHNDYVKLTKDYLRSYPYYKQAVKNMTDDIEEIKVRLADESPKTPSYGLDTGGGGYSELNATERAADNRLHLERRCEQLQDNRRQLQIQIDKVDAAIGKLSVEDQEIVRLFYFEHLTHRDLAQRAFLSERSSKRHIQKATDSIALMLFGLDTQRDIFFLRGF